MRAEGVYILQRGVQWKQGVVICMMLYTVLLYNTTPIHRTPLPLHPPLQSIHVFHGAPDISVIISIIIISIIIISMIIISMIIIIVIIISAIIIIIVVRGPRVVWKGCARGILRYVWGRQWYIIIIIIVINTSLSLYVYIYIYI